MPTSITVRSLSALAFVGFGIGWAAGGHAASTAALWVISFVALAFAALWYEVAPQDRPHASTLWHLVPGSSKNPDDYR